MSILLQFSKKLVEKGNFLTIINKVGFAVFNKTNFFHQI